MPLTHNTPFTQAVAITPSDSVNLTAGCRGIYVGAAGDITAVVETGTTAVLFSNCVAGSILPGAFTRVNSTGTTATGLVAMN